MPDTKNGSDALSLRTLVDYTPDSSTDDAPPRYRDAVPDARRDGPGSPSRSSFFSSPPMSVSEWTPDSASEFSEGQPLLNGARTPPPQYRSPRGSVSLSVVGSLDQEVGTLLLEPDDPHHTAPDDPRKRRGCRGRRDRSCKRRESDWAKMRVIVAVILMCFIVGFVLGLVVTTRARRGSNRHGGPPVPGWAKADCSSKDGRYNHYEFNDIRDLEISDGPHGAFSGLIRVLPPLHGQTADLVMKQIAKKTKALDIRINGHPSSGTLSKEARDLSSSLEKRRGKCDADVVLYFRDGLSINDLRIDTHAGDIQVFSPLRVTGTTSLTSKSGRVDAGSFFNTRRTYISSGSSSLSGHFKLYDFLSITSTSGVIDVTIEPQEVDKKRPEPAELEVKSQSGRINLDTTRRPPGRDYVTSVESRDGRISGTILHGSQTVVKSTSGMIELDVLPVGNAASNLHISTASGRQQVTVLSPVFPSGTRTDATLWNMASKHYTQSGALQLRYPGEWGGTIEGSTSSGSIEVTGPRVFVLNQNPHHVRAERDADEGGSMLTFQGESGSAKVTFLR